MPYQQTFSELQLRPCDIINIVRELDSLRAELDDIRAKLAATHAKLDADTGVADANYASTLALPAARFTAV